MSAARRLPRLAGLALLALAAPAWAQRADLRPDPAGAADEARRWLDATLADLDRGRKVIVPTPEGPLPYVVVDRSSLSEAHDWAAATGGSDRDALRWSAQVLRQQRDLRARLTRTRELVLAGAGPAAPPAADPSPAAGPRIAVVRGTPDAPASTPGPRPAPASTDPPPATPEATPPVGDDLTAIAEATPPVDPTATDDPAAIGDPTAAPLPASSASPGDVPASPGPAVAAPAIVGGGGGGGVRGGRAPGPATWAAIALGLLAVALGGAVLVARRRPPGAAPTAPPPPPAPEAKIDLVLELTSPVGRGSLRFERAPIVVGRDPASDLVIDDPRVSRRHARIVVERDALWIEDLGSRGGLRIDGRGSTRGELRRGTTVRLGDSVLRVR